MTRSRPSVVRALLVAFAVLGTFAALLVIVLVAGALMFSGAG